MPIASSKFSGCDNKKCRQTSPNVLEGPELPQLRTAGLDRGWMRLRGDIGQESVNRVLGSDALGQNPSCTICSLGGLGHDASICASVPKSVKGDNNNICSQ